MDNSSGGGIGGFKIEKLGESSYHVWMQKVELVLALRELEDHIYDSRPPIDEAELAVWQKNDAKARAIFCLTLYEEHLEHVRELESAAEMWEAIKNLFQRKTLLKRLTARLRVYAVKMTYKEKAIAFISRVRQPTSDKKAMGEVVSDQEITMAVLCGLPAKYEHRIVVIDTVADDEKLMIEFVKGRLLQEEHRLSDRSSSPSLSSTSGPNSALVMRTCCGASTRQGERYARVSHCGKKGHPESKRLKKHPHLRPTNSKQKGLVSDANFDSPNPMTLMKPWCV